MNIIAKKVSLFVFFIAVCVYADKPRFDNEEEVEVEVEDKPEFDNSDYKPKETKNTSRITQEGQKFGIRAGLSLYDYSPGVNEMDKYVDMGHGWGVWLVVNIPLTKTLSFVPEVGFLYRKPFIINIDEDMYGIEVHEHGYISEFAISIPAMLKFTPAEGIPFYLAFGIQLDIPTKSETAIEAEVDGRKVNTDTESRASIDFGIPLGVGYLITPNLDIDLRAVIGITSPSYEGGTKDSWNQYGAGLTYYF
jgi:hypothetical protein